jgi:hypothetical protein
MDADAENIQVLRPPTAAFDRPPTEQKTPTFKLLMPRLDEEIFERCIGRFLNSIKSQDAIAYQR